MKGKRYTTKHKGEEKSSRSIREMIEMIKNEQVQYKEIDFNNLTVSKHAILRVTQYFKCPKIQSIKIIKNLLECSERVGEQLANDGRINVLYVHNQFAIYLSPNLDTVVTVRRFQKLSYAPIRKMLPTLKKELDGDELRQTLINLHKEAWRKVESKEKQEMETVLEIEREINEQLEKLKLLKKGYSPSHFRKYVKNRINEEYEKLVAVGETLFKIKKEKRHIGKSISSLL